MEIPVLESLSNTVKSLQAARLTTLLKRNPRTGVSEPITAQKMKFSVKDFFSKCDHICSFLRIWSHLLNKSLIENFILWAVNCLQILYNNSQKSQENIYVGPFLNKVQKQLFTDVLKKQLFLKISQISQENICV